MAYNYNMLWSLLELIYGSSLLLVLAICATMVSNKMTSFISPNRKILSLLVHIFLLVFLLYFVRVLLDELLYNKDLVSTIFMITGPIIGATSLYLGPIIKEYTMALIK